MQRLTEVFWTVLAGVSVFVVGQLFLRVVVDPIQELWKLTGEIAHSLIYYANVYSSLTAPDRKEEAKVAFRDKAAQLQAKAYAIIWYSLWWLLRLTPKKSDVIESSRCLIALSNFSIDTSSDAGSIAARIEDKIR